MKLQYMTKKLILIVVCILFPVIAEGEDWVMVATSSDMGFGYIDRSSIKQVTSSQYKAWYKIKLIDTEQPLRKIKTYILCDCLERRTKDLQSTFYKLDGSHFSTGEEDWKHAIPESNLENVLNFVCNYKGVLNIPKRDDN